MGRVETEPVLLLQQASHRAQIPTGAEDVQHPLTLLHEPGIEPAPPGAAAAQERAIQIGHQHQLRLVGQPHLELILQAGAAGSSGLGHGLALPRGAGGA
jgi:hypothetical protein